MDVHSKASLCDQNSPADVAALGRDGASITKKLTEDVVIIVDDEIDIKSTTDRKVIARKKPEAAAAEDVIAVASSSSVVDRSLESVESSSLATSNSEQPHQQQHRRRYSNLSNLAQSLPSTTLSSSLTCGGFSGVAASTTAGGSLDHVSGVRIRKSMSGGGSRRRGGSKRNSSDSGRVRPKYSVVESTSKVVDDSVQVVGVGEMQGGVRRTRSALETTRGTRAGVAAVELVAEDCDSPSEEITSKSPLLVQREIPFHDGSQPREKKRDTASPNQLLSLPGRSH